MHAVGGVVGAGACDDPGAVADGLEHGAQQRDLLVVVGGWRLTRGARDDQTVAPGVDVVFLDTGYHFAETIGTRDAVEAVYGVNVVNVTPENSVAKQDELLGKDLFARDAAACCRMRKVEPLGKALKGYSAWVTGIRRVEAPTRANAPLISFDKAFGLVKINPIAKWSDDQVDAYIEERGILVNPLRSEGYPSIGCSPCTAPVAAGADPRSGRWADTSKSECGLHI